MNSGIQTEKNHLGNSFINISPPDLANLLPKWIRADLAQGHDLMHVDADAFLVRDPHESFSLNHLDADIVASIDLAGGYYSWYITPPFLERHGGIDPFEER